jgi:ribosomal-protein-alanine N-acetyltransferase
MGYCLAKKYWNLGIMTESLKAAIDYLFSQTYIKRIESWHFIENKASGKVMKKSGMKFKFVKEKVDNDNDGVLRDIAIYEIVKQ